MTIQAENGEFTVDWPWPQVKFTSHYQLLFAKADWGLAQGLAAEGIITLVLFELYNNGSTWYAVAKVNLGPVAEVSAVKVLDFNLCYVVSTFGQGASGQLKVQNWMRRPRVNIDTHEQLPTIDCPNFIAGCNFNGQAVIGGVVNDNPSWQYSDTESLMWSAIGRFNFKLQDKGAGGCRAHWGDQGHGFVYHVAKLGKGLLVLGDGGRMGLAPVSEPMVTYSPVSLEGPGIKGPNYAAGDEHIQGFITQEGDWVTYDSQFKEVIYGYRERLA